MKTAWWQVGVLGLSLAAGCTSTPAVPPEDAAAADAATPSDAGVPDDAALDTGGAADVGSVPDAGASYPGYDPLPSRGGPVLASPSFVTLTYADEPNRDVIEAFGDAMANDPWWGPAVSEYGVGPLTSLGNVRLTDAAPTSTTQAEVETYLVSLADAGMLPHAADGTYDGIVAMLYFPATSSVTLTDGAASCSGWHGVHGEIVGRVHLVYALSVTCPGARGFDEIGYLEAAASHELEEAVTDPSVDAAPAYQVASRPIGPWSIYGELTDRCVGSYLRRTGYVLARNWSNVAAATPGADPCVPAPDGDVFFSLTTPSTTVHGPAGATIDVPLTGWTAGAIPDFLVRTSEAAGFRTSPRLDRSRLNDGVGTTLHVTIPAGTRSGSAGWVVLLTSPDYGTDTSRESGESHNFPILVIAD